MPPELRQPDAALDAWQRAVDLAPRLWDTLYNLGTKALEHGRPEQAREALAAFVAGAPKERYAADLRRARVLLGRLQRAGVLGDEQRASSPPLGILLDMTFRDRLLATLRALEPILEETGVLVIGSEVPNLLEPDAAATLVVSQDVDIGIAVTSHAAVKRRLNELRGYTASRDEPSVWLPVGHEGLEINFVGMDSDIDDAADTYVLEDSELPLLVFGTLSFLKPAPPVEIEGLTIPVPRVAGLLLEKLLTERTSVKGDRDLLVALGLILVADGRDLDELTDLYHALRPEQRYSVRSNLSVLSLLAPHPNMPDPRPRRARVAELLRRLELRQDSSDE